MAKEKIKKEKKKVWVLQAQVISVLRRLFLRSPIFSECRKRAKIYRDKKNKDGSVSKAQSMFYKCELCGAEYPDRKVEFQCFDKNGNIVIDKKTKQPKTVKTHPIAVDHCSPVINTDGSTRLENGEINWNEYISRMFCGFTIIDWKETSKLNLTNKAQLICKKCHDFKTLSENQNRLSK